MSVVGCCRHQTVIRHVRADLSAVLSCVECLDMVMHGRLYIRRSLSTSVLQFITSLAHNLFEQNLQVEKHCSSTFLLFEKSVINVDSFHDV